jgi:diguanylate cyclase (GGDEF)-like protein
VHAVSRLPRSTIWHRAALVRNFVELLSTPASAGDVWPMCCQPLALLTDARLVTIVFCAEAGDRIVCQWADGVANAPQAPQPVSASVAAEVLASNVTVVREHAGGTAAVGVPIRFGTALLGAICIEGAPKPDRELITLLESCALSAGARVNTDAMLDNTARYERLAFTDALTGIANRRRFDETLAVEWARAARGGTALTILMMDVDHFKLYNDSYGHPAGDLCLQRIANLIKENTRRSSDLCARYGGEEFVALLPGLDLAGGTRVAEALRANIAERSIEHEGSSLGRVSLSIGVATIVPTFDAKREALVLAADAALYEAKRAGRNRVSAAGYVPETGPESAVVRRVAPLNNLPQQHTRLIGRVTEVSEITALLEDGPLVTLTACGGAGKTRISVSIATELAASFADGTWFVDLARVTDPALIPGAIGALLGLEISPGENAANSLARALGGKSSLLIFDNCEHVLEAIAHVATALLHSCQDVRILATSREALGIRGETVYRLPLLSVPPADVPVDALCAADYDAVALFVERAKAVKRDFQITDENAATIASICRQLDGIALAIELAAARVVVLSVGEIAQRLGERFRLLRGGDRTALPRQQTMRALVDWSYDLLSLEEQLVFRRLSVFVGGWTLEAMSEICAGAELDEDDILDLLGGLVRKSLVVDSIDDSTSRYRLLESVREYAGEKLEGDASHEDLRRRHAGYYLRFAKAAHQTYYTTPCKRWLTKLQPEIENFRSALHWSLALGKDVTLGATLAGALVMFLSQVSPNEYLRWTRMALAALPADCEPAVEAALWRGIGRAAANLPADQMRAAAERSVTLARIVGDAEPLGDALRGLMVVLGWYYPDEKVLVAELARETMDLARSVGEPIQIALGLRSLSLTIDNSDVTQKLAVLEESLTLLLAHGNDIQAAIGFMWLAEYDFCFCGGKKASIYAREAMRFSEESGSASMLAQMATNLAQYAAAEGDWNAALHAAAEAAEASTQLGMEDQVTWAVQALAMVCAGTGEYLTSARLLGFCDGRTGKLHSERQVNFAEDILYRRLLTTLREQLGPAALDAAQLSGSSLAEAEALQLGLACGKSKLESAATG